VSYILPRERSILWAVPIGAVLASCQASLVAYDIPKDGNDDTPTDAAPTTDTEVDGDDDDDITTTPPDVDDIDIDLDGVSPWYGTADHEVTISGGPFAPDTVIRFDDVDVQIVSLEGDAVTVRVPDLGVDLVAEITATSSEGASPAPLEFMYFEEGAGRIGAIGTVEWNDYRGGYWDTATVDAGFAQVMLSLPTTFQWEEIVYAGLRDTCERDWALGVTTYVYDPGVATLVLSSGANQLVLPADAVQPYVFFAGDLPVQPGSTYDLQPITGNPNWPDFGVPDLAGTVPTAIAVTTPNIDATAFPIVPSTITLNWSGPFTGDSVLVYMQRMRYDGAAFQPQETVSCWLTDDGAHIVPNMWLDWNTGDDYVYMAVGRASKPQNVILPHNGAFSDVTGVYWSVGFLDAG
jgi:hypothetical protein